MTAAPNTASRGQASTGSRATGRAPRRYRPPTAAELHRAWLDLVDADGPFLAIPPLKRVWPQGIPQLPTEVRDTLATARAEFERAWEALDRAPDNEVARAEFQRVRADWVRAVLRDVAGWQDLAVWGAGAAPEAAVASANRRVHVAPSAALRGPDGVAALVHVVPVTESLRDAGTDGWAASEVDRMEAMLRASGVPIGIVTDGRWWGLVCARPKVMVASGIVDALTWGEEPRTRDAFLTLIHRRHIVGGDADERLPKLFAESVAAAEEITEALGSQVRRAVELLVQAFSEAHAETRRHGRVSPLPDDGHTVYQACVTVMMQVVFLLFAEERGLLPQSHLFTHSYGISGELDALERRAPRRGRGSPRRHLLDLAPAAGHRQALSHGAAFEDMRMPAYGGSLFDPARFPFLHATGGNATLALPIPDRVMLHVLRSVQIAQLSGADARRICFRDIDVEQIGYIYEGLLGYTCTVVTDAAQLGLLGASGNEPEIPLTVLENLAGRHETPATLVTAILAWVKENQPAAKRGQRRRLPQGPDHAPCPGCRRTPPPRGHRRRNAARAAADLAADHPPRPARTPHRRPRRRPAGHRDPVPPQRRRPLHPQRPRRDRRPARPPAALLLPRPVPDRRPDAWKLKSPDELLALKVADIAAGSGAFLVAAARYLADRLVEAWIAETPPTLTYPTCIAVQSARSSPTASTAPTSTTWPSKCASSPSGWSPSTGTCRSPSSTTRSSTATPCSASPTCANSKPFTSTPHVRSRPGPGTGIVDAVVHRATEIRRGLANEVQENDPQRSANAKRRQLGRLHELTAQTPQTADGVIAAGLRLGGKPGKQLDEAYENLREALAQAHPIDGTEPKTGLFDRIVANGLTPTVHTDYDRWKPLHWILEVPDVIVDHGGFDAVIGNPPFLGGQKLTGAMGTNMRDWFVHQLAAGARGSADLVAYFLLRATALLKSSGTLGLIATNTIAQGDTREVGLDQMVQRGFTITRGVQSAPWPAASANLEYAAVWGSRRTDRRVCDP